MCVPKKQFKSMLNKIKQIENDGKKIFVGFLSVLFLMSYLFSLFLTSGFVNQVTGDCLFMSHTEVVCLASPFGHIVEWQSSFTSTIPTQILTLMIFGALLFSVSVIFTTQKPIFNHDSTRILVLFQYIKAKLRTFFHRLWQELFAQGILHPKTY